MVNNIKIMFTKWGKCGKSILLGFRGQKGGKTFGPNIKAKFKIFIFSYYGTRHQ